MREKNISVRRRMCQRETTLFLVLYYLTRCMTELQFPPRQNTYKLHQGPKITRGFIVFSVAAVPGYRQTPRSALRFPGGVLPHFDQKLSLSAMLCHHQRVFLSKLQVSQEHQAHQACIAGKCDISQHINMDFHRPRRACNISVWKRTCAVLEQLKYLSATG